MKYVEPPEPSPDHNPNVTQVHPLKDFLYILFLTILSLGFLYVVIGFVSDLVVERISPETEQKIATKFSWRSVVQPKPDSSEAKLQEFFSRLQKGAGEIRLPLNISIMQDDGLNAAILPGGHVYVTSGLLKESETENELAFVLGHELGHFIHRDNLKALSRTILNAIIFSFLGMGLEKADSLSSAGVFNQLADLNYGRNQEAKADRFGVDLVAQNYGHVGNSLDFFTRIKKKEDESILGSEKVKGIFRYWSTHPLTEDRITSLQAYIQQKGYKTTGIAVKKNF